MSDPTLALAERVVEIADSLRIRTALIGAAALAVHGYTRGTQDLDLATAVAPDSTLREFAQALERAGIANRLQLPDEDDPLGGVIRIWTSEDEDGHTTAVVEVVNFLNPLRPTRNPGAQTLLNAAPIEGTPLRCASLPDLVALKLYAGGRADHADIVQLLARTPAPDLDAIRSAAGPYDRSGVLETLIAEAIESRA